MESEILQRSAKIVFRNSSMRDSTLTFAMSFSHKYNMRYIRDLILFGKEFFVLWCKVESRCLLERAGYKIVTSKKIKSSLTLIDTTRIQAWFNEGNFNCELMLAQLAISGTENLLTIDFLRRKPRQAIRRITRGAPQKNENPIGDVMEDRALGSFPPT